MGKEKYKAIKEGCLVVEGILRKVVDDFNGFDFKTEREVYDFILKDIKKKGLKPAFPPLVCNGNYTNFHKKPYKSKKLQRGFLIIDLGVRVRGYCSDLTRTFYLGKASKKDKKRYGILKRVQERILGRVEKVKKYYDLDKEVRGMLGRYGRFFLHPLGHGVGRKIHQSPYIGSQFKKKRGYDKKRRRRIKKRKVREGDIFTIEPGIYGRGFGMRIEDVVSVGENRVEVLTSFPKKLKELRLNK